MKCTCKKFSWVGNLLRCDDCRMRVIPFYCGEEFRLLHVTWGLEV